MRWIWRGLAGLILVLTVASAGGYLWLLTGLARTEGEIAAPGLAAAVDIARDANGVPHIFASNDRDAFYALGYAHAQDRLWQMDMMRRLGAGRLSEIFGSLTLQSDRFMRTLGLYRIAEADFARLSPDLSARMTAYTAGVNAYLDGHSGAWPPEFHALNYRPEPWRPADSLVWGKIMALMLSGNWRTELLRARMATRLSAKQMAALWPAYPDGAPLTLGARHGLYDRLGLDRLARALNGTPQSASASNNWVVDGAHSDSGKPLLANDPHLRLSAPSIWYLVRISTPETKFSGATAPGVPLPIIGHNGHIAWGFTTTNGDAADLFIERIDPGRPDHYLTPNGSRPFVSRAEIIRVRGGGDREITIRATRHGPVLSDLVGADAVPPGHVLVLAWTALRADDKTAEAQFQLARARDWRQFVAALRHFHSPQQSIVYADTAGNIGFYAPARIPIRRSGDGSAPVPGWTGDHDWTGFIPFDALPHGYNPPSGRIATANHRITADGDRYHLSRDWDLPYRIRRIDSLLAAKARHSRASMAAIQADQVSLAARDLLPYMAAARTGDVRAKAALALLGEWDATMARDRPEPLIYTAWLREVNRALYADELGALFDDYWNLRPNVVTHMLRREPAWCDNVNTPAPENCADMLGAALVRALDRLGEKFGADMARWRWGKAHMAYFPHRLFGRIPLIGPWFDIGIANGGGEYTINRGTTRIAHPDRPFRHVHGPGFRAIYDLADLSSSRFMQGPGQSGNPLSPHYGDLIDAWRDVGHFRLAGNLAAILSQGGHRLTLRPAKPD